MTFQFPVAVAGSGKAHGLPWMSASARPGLWRPPPVPAACLCVGTGRLRRCGPLALCRPSPSGAVSEQEMRDKERIGSHV